MAQQGGFFGGSGGGFGFGAAGGGSQQAAAPGPSTSFAFGRGATAGPVSPAPASGFTFGVNPGSQGGGNVAGASPKAGFGTAAVAGGGGGGSFGSVPQQQQLPQQQRQPPQPAGTFGFGAGGQIQQQQQPAAGFGFGARTAEPTRGGFGGAAARPTAAAPPAAGFSFGVGAASAEPAAARPQQQQQTWNQRSTSPAGRGPAGLAARAFGGAVGAARLQQPKQWQRQQQPAGAEAVYTNHEMADAGGEDYAEGGQGFDYEAERRMALASMPTFAGGGRGGGATGAAAGAGRGRGKRGAAAVVDSPAQAKRPQFGAAAAGRGAGRAGGRGGGSGLAGDAQADAKKAARAARFRDELSGPPSRAAQAAAAAATAAMRGLQEEQEEEVEEAGEGGGFDYQAERRSALAGMPTFAGGAGGGGGGGSTPKSAAVPRAAAPQRPAPARAPRPQPTRTPSSTDMMFDEEAGGDGHVVGVCEMMCPPRERERRQRQRDVAFFERPDPNNPDLTNAKLAVKKYARKVTCRMSDPQPGDEDFENSEIWGPADVRTVPALQHTMAYLRSLMDRSGISFGVLHKFLWDRHRSVRQDLGVQKIQNADSAAMLEEMVRFNIMAEHEMTDVEGSEGAGDTEAFSSHLNIEQLSKSLTTLFDTYEKYNEAGEALPFEAEFRSYGILLRMAAFGGFDPRATAYEFMRDLRSMRPEIQTSAEVQLALRMYNAFRDGSWGKFFRLCRSAPYLFCCCAFIHWGTARTRALRALVMTAPPVGRRLSYIPLDRLVHLLAFNGPQDAADFCAAHNMPVEEGPGGAYVVLLDKANFIDAPTVKRFRSDIISSKASEFPSMDVHPEQPPAAVSGGRALSAAALPPHRVSSAAAAAPLQLPRRPALPAAAAAPAVRPVLAARPTAVAQPVFKEPTPRQPAAATAGAGVAASFAPGPGAFAAQQQLVPTGPGTTQQQQQQLNPLAPSFMPTSAAPQVSFQGQQAAASAAAPLFTFGGQPPAVQQQVAAAQPAAQPSAPFFPPQQQTAQPLVPQPLFQFQPQQQQPGPPGPFSFGVQPGVAPGAQGQQQVAARAAPQQQHASWAADVGQSAPAAAALLRTTSQQVAAAKAAAAAKQREEREVALWQGRIRAANTRLVFTFWRVAAQRQRKARERAEMERLLQEQLKRERERLLRWALRRWRHNAVTSRLRRRIEENLRATRVGIGGGLMRPPPLTVQRQRPAAQPGTAQQQEQERWLQERQAMWQPLDLPGLAFSTLSAANRGAPLLYWKLLLVSTSSAAAGGSTTAAGAALGEAASTSGMGRWVAAKLFHPHDIRRDDLARGVTHRIAATQSRGNGGGAPHGTLVTATVDLSACPEIVSSSYPAQQHKQAFGGGREGGLPTTPALADALGGASGVVLVVEDGAEEEAEARLRALLRRLPESGPPLPLLALASCGAAAQRVHAALAGAVADAQAGGLLGAARVAHCTTHSADSTTAGGAAAAAVPASFSSVLLAEELRQLAADAPLQPELKAVSAEALLRRQMGGALAAAASAAYAASAAAAGRPEQVYHSSSKARGLVDGFNDALGGVADLVRSSANSQAALWRWPPADLQPPAVPSSWVAALRLPPRWWDSGRLAAQLSALGSLRLPRYGEEGEGPDGGSAAGWGGGTGSSVSAYVSQHLTIAGGGRQDVGGGVGSPPRLLPAFASPSSSPVGSPEGNGYAAANGRSSGGAGFLSPAAEATAVRALEQALHALPARLGDGGGGVARRREEELEEGGLLGCLVLPAEELARATAAKLQRTEGPPLSAADLPPAPLLGRWPQTCQPPSALLSAPGITLTPQGPTTTSFSPGHDGTAPAGAWATAGAAAAASPGQLSEPHAALLDQMTTRLREERVRDEERERRFLQAVMDGEPGLGLPLGGG